MGDSTFEIDFEPIGKRVDVAPGTNLLEAARQAGIGLASVCGGEGTCGRCRVTIMSGNVTPPVDADRRYLSQLELTSGQRLACRCQIYSDVKVHVPKASLVTNQRLQVSGLARKMQIEAAVHAYEIEVPEPTLYDLRSDLDRVIDALETAHGQRKWFAEPAVIRTLSALARHTAHDAAWHLTVYARNNEIVGFEAAGHKPIGFAADLGTTKIAGYLVDLETGEELAANGIMNPQIGYGEDVISRMVHATRNDDGSAELARVVREGFNNLIIGLAYQAGVSQEQIVEACIVGNTAMTHLLLDLPVHQLSVSPFVAATSTALDVKARELDLDMAAGAYVHVLPCVGGFVGADHVAMILGSDLDRKPYVAVGVDIGTNTEIALLKPNEKTLTSASCASGPAFEGAHIRDGMRASTGAIEGVRIVDGVPQIKTIGDAPPVGVCGSGIVDAIAEMYRAGVINNRGRMNREAPGVRKGEKGWEFVLASAEISGTGRDIVITQADVNEIQLAKGAIEAGLNTLIVATKTPPEEIKEVIVAGAFGSYLNLDSALAIGLLPRLPNARYLQVGNAAGVGAKMALLSLKERQRAQQIMRRTGYIELTTQDGFNSRFAMSMLLPKNNPS
ncbi:MAG: ASKHA domain-containing protein [Anaerolineae bacterium]